MANMTSLFRKFSFTPQMDGDSETQSDVEPMIPSLSRRKSSTTSVSHGRIYGARDYKLSIGASNPEARRSSLTSTMVDFDDPARPQSDRISSNRIYGCRDYKLTMPKEAKRARRNTVLEQDGITPPTVVQRRYSNSYCAGHHASADREGVKESACK